MAYSHEEIIKALTVIKTICNETPKCSHCPFYSVKENGCVFHTMTPSAMYLSENMIWHAVQ